MKPVRIAAFFLPFLVACSDSKLQSPAVAAAMDAHQQAAAAPASLPQRLELFIDGEPLTMEVDRPRDGHVSVNQLVGNALNITAMDRARNVFLSVSAMPMDGTPMGPGTYQSFRCHSADDCSEAEHAFDARHNDTALMPFPGQETKPGELVRAYKAPALQLTPTTVVITSMKDAYWHGVGPTKRVVGTFSGTLASVENNKEGRPVVVGPLRKVEGKFDIYTGRMM